MIAIPFWMLLAAGQHLTADQIMALVGANQDRAMQARAEFVYNQDQLVRLLKPNGKLACEAHSQFVVTPTAKGERKQQTMFAAKGIVHGKEVEYRSKEDLKDGIDSSLCTEFRDFGSESKDKDGVSRDLFPLAGKELRFYDFTLEGEEVYQGVQAYKVSFEPKDKLGERPWAGEALISKTDFEPIMVTTRLAFKIPIAVRVVLGTNLEHLGFKVSYRKFDDGVWFPVSYGGEFRLRVLFFYARRVGISIRNDGFTRAKVDSTVKFAKVE